MYAELLKQLYYDERTKLEAMWVYKQEAKLRILKVKKAMVERAQGRLTNSEILGREDIAEEIKDNILRDGRNEERFRQRVDKNLDSEVNDIVTEEQRQLQSVNYSAEDFADYLLQLEKVAALEDIISEERMFPEAVYEEQRQLQEKPKEA